MLSGSEASGAAGGVAYMDASLPLSMTRQRAFFTACHLRKRFWFADPGCHSLRNGRDLPGQNLLKRDIRVQNLTGVEKAEECCSSVELVERNLTELLLQTMIVASGWRVDFFKAYS